MVLMQNELVPGSWQRHEIQSPTVAVVWFEKKPKQPVKELLPTTVFGPHAIPVEAALGAMGIVTTRILNYESLVHALVEKNLYILTTNIAGLEVGGTTSNLWSRHRRLALTVAREVLRIQAHLVGEALPEEKLLASLERALLADADGRMILPQVIAIRDVLDNDAINIVLKEDQVENFFKTSGITPKLAITDSQVFGKMKDIVPAHVPFTSFSIMLARFRGDFKAYLDGTPKIDELQDGDRVLILESCTHQVNCDDIGRFKLPNWIKEYTGKNIKFDIVAGLDKISRNTEDYKMVIQCGGCMVTRKQLRSRLKPAKDAQIAISNYGMAIAWVNGMFDRVTEPFRKVYA